MQNKIFGGKMKEIKLSIKDENLNTVLTILENLKSGLIENIDYEGKKSSNVRYVPKSSEVVREGVKPKGKYISKAEYQKRKLKP